MRRSMTRSLALFLGGCLLACTPTPAGPKSGEAGRRAGTKSNPDAKLAESTGGGETSKTGEVQAPTEDPNFEWKADEFGDSKILRYQVPGFDELPLEQKKLVYYLYQAALSGRDIIFDQKYRHNLSIRRTLEAALTSYAGDKSSEDWGRLQTYAKQFFFARGVHHDYSSKKFIPEFSKEYFAEVVKSLDPKTLPLEDGEDADALLARLEGPIFDAKLDAKRVNRDEGADLIADSANNFYGEGITQKEVEKFYAAMIDKKDETPISYGLNSKLVKEDGKLVEKVWKVDGMYGPAISQIVGWLDKAATVAENAQQKKALTLLAEFYRTGDLAKFDEYSIAWAKDTDSRVDTVNGFIEVYGDAMGYRGTYEAVLSIKDLEATKRIKTIGDEAQWFEDNSPIDDAHKKKNVIGISAKVITVVVESGDAAPTTPIGINLPNANWIRTQHGSKSVNLGNIVAAYDESQKGGGALEEFACSQDEVSRAQKYGPLASTLKVDMHEVIGHASGTINEGVGTPKETLKNYSSALEEGRADLVALYYVMDPKLVELGLMPDLDVGKAAYDGYVRNGLMTQLRRIDEGEQIEESHMRNRQMVAAWAFEKGAADKVIERVDADGKTCFRINDYEKLRALFGQLLAEIQRIKSEGDFKAGKKLIEDYGVKVDAKLHEEVLERFSTLDTKAYSGFIQPRLVAVMEGDEIVDVKIEYPTDFLGQQLEYSKDYSFLPNYN